MDCDTNRRKSLNGRRLDFDKEVTTDIVNGNMSTRYRCDFIETMSNKHGNNRENGTDSQHTVSRFNSSNMVSFSGLIVFYSFH
jgi:hypothetical protein